MKTIVIDPIAKPRMTQSDRWNTRPCTQRYYDFKDELVLQWGDGEVPEQCSLVFLLPMPKSWSKKKKLEMYGKPHRQKPDIDNLIKSFLDCLLEDDSHVYMVHAAKFWSEEGAIRVKRIDGYGAAISLIDILPGVNPQGFRS